MSLFLATCYSFFAEIPAEVTNFQARQNRQTDAQTNKHLFPAENSTALSVLCNGCCLQLTRH